MSFKRRMELSKPLKQNKTLLLTMFLPPLSLICLITFMLNVINQLRYIVEVNKEIEDCCFNGLIHLNTYYPLLCDNTSNMYNVITKKLSNEIRPDMYLMKEKKIWLITFSDALKLLSTFNRAILLSTNKVDVFDWRQNMYLTSEFIFVIDNRQLRSHLTHLTNYLKEKDSAILRFLLNRLKLNIRLTKYSKLTTFAYINDSLSFIPTTTFINTSDLSDPFVENLLINCKSWIKKFFKFVKEKKAEEFSTELFIEGILSIFVKTGLLKMTGEEIKEALTRDYKFIYSMFPFFRELNPNLPAVLKYNEFVCASLGFDLSKLLLNEELKKYFDKEKLARLLNYTDKFLICNFLDQ
ncbi:hypothetical protein CDIK_3511 [Cucumispora dikerogammari]|nr:hypothetical protein CDIK_3511 [Cucumispora dikerogammari]